MQGAGAGWQLLEWIRVWLSDRKQRVVLNGEASEWAEVLSGDPQGSVLILILVGCCLEMNEGIFAFKDGTGTVGAAGKVIG